MNSMRSLYGFVVGFAALFAAPGPVTAKTTPHAVLILNQSNAYRPWPHAIITELRSRIIESFGNALPFYTENLDLYRFKGNSLEIQLQAYLQEKYRDKPIGEIAVVGPVALALALRLRPALRPAGRSASSIPITAGEPSKPVFDWRQLL